MPLYNNERKHVQYAKSGKINGISQNYGVVVVSHDNKQSTVRTLTPAFSTCFNVSGSLSSMMMHMKLLFVITLRG